MVREMLKRIPLILTCSLLFFLSEAMVPSRQVRAQGVSEPPQIVVPKPLPMPLPMPPSKAVVPVPDYNGLTIPPPPTEPPPQGDVCSVLTDHEARKRLNCPEDLH